MARTKLPKQLSESVIERFLAEAERLHKSIVQPLLSPSSDHFRALQRTHEALLKTVKDITGKYAPFILWNVRDQQGPPRGSGAIGTGGRRSSGDKGHYAS